MGKYVFVLILNAKIPKFTNVKFDKKLTFTWGMVDLNMYKTGPRTGHFKTI